MPVSRVCKHPLQFTFSPAECVSWHLTTRRTDSFPAWEMRLPYLQGSLVSSISKSSCGTNRKSIVYTLNATYNSSCWLPVVLRPTFRKAQSRMRPAWRHDTNEQRTLDDAEPVDIRQTRRQDSIDKTLKLLVAHLPKTWQPRRRFLPKFRRTTDVHGASPPGIPE